MSNDKLAEAIERVREGMAPRAERDAVCDAAQRTQRYDEKVQLRVLELMRERDSYHATLAGIERLLRAGYHSREWPWLEHPTLAAAVQAALAELDKETK